MRAVAVTGVGIVGPLGDADSTWRALLEGRTATTRATFEKVRLPSISDVLVTTMGAVPWAEFVPGPEGRNLNPESAAFLVASAMALRQAGLAGQSTDAIGVCAGTRYAGIDDYVQFYLDSLVWGPHRVRPVLGANSGFNGPASHTSIRMRFRGPNLTISTRDTSGLQAIAHAADLVRSGRVDIVIAGGVDRLSYMRVAALRSAGTLSDHIARPYDRDRTRPTPGEGAAVMVVEAADHARRRQVEPLAFIGSAASAFRGCCREAVAVCIQQVIRRSEITSVGAILSSAAGDADGDRDEAWAIADAFGPEAERIPICAVHGAAGQWAGAGSALQVAMAIESMRSGVVPPTAGFANRDSTLPNLRFDGDTVEKRVSSALVCSLDRAGPAAALVLTRNPQRSLSGE